MTATASSDRGFTLLEVMIALAIVATALTALLGLANRSIGVHDRLEKTTRATLLAGTRLAEVELAAGTSSGQSDSDGVFAPPDELYRWQVRWLPTPLPSVRQVDVIVLWGEAQKNEQVTVTSFIRDSGGNR